MTKVADSTMQEGWVSQVVKGEFCEKWNRRPNFTDNQGSVLQTFVVQHLTRHQGNCITKTTTNTGNGSRTHRFGMDVAKLGAVGKEVIR